ncbi:MAG: FecCD family ABC transporter permease [Chloroflexota bacterium]
MAGTSVADKPIPLVVFPYRRRLPVVIGGLALLTVGLALLGVSLGAVSVPVDHVVRILAGRLGLLQQTGLVGSADEQIILAIRLPRVVAAILVGAGLATAGVIFQGLLRNPMADPYVIGTSGGASLGATVALMATAQLGWQLEWLGFGLVPVCAFVGASVTVMIVYNVARVGKRTPITTLLLAGFAIGSMLTAVMSFLMLIGEHTLRGTLLWLMGGLGTSTWEQLAFVGVLVLAGLLVTYAFAEDLNALLLGEEQASFLGVEVEKRKGWLLVLGSLLTGAAVSISGLIGFVGLVVPHVARLAFGPDHRLLVPAAALLGGSFLLLADLIARLVLAPTEIPVGIVTALTGAPFFLYLLRRHRHEYRL